MIYRQQALVAYNGLSECAHVCSRVPQGLIPGPTLFLLFINYLPLSLQYCSSDFYADDATVHFRHIVFPWASVCLSICLSQMVSALLHVLENRLSSIHESLYKYQSA